MDTKTCPRLTQAEERALDKMVDADIDDSKPTNEEDEDED